MRLKQRQDFLTNDRELVKAAAEGANTKQSDPHARIYEIGRCECIQTAPCVQRLGRSFFDAGPYANESASKALAVKLNRELRDINLL